MPTPRKRDILERAKELSMMRVRDLPAITPEDYELREEGTFTEAQRDLMRGEGRYAGEQRRYLDTMAQEMKLKVIRHTEFRKALSEMKKIGFEWGNGWIKKHLPKPILRKKPRIPGVQIPRVQIPAPPVVKISRAPKKVRIKRKELKAKKRRLHTSRTGKTMRALRKIDGVKVFSFPDDVWGVKKPRRKKK